ncbi:MAG: hypothetical protein ABIS92_09590 [Polyangia bacterium]
MVVMSVASAAAAVALAIGVRPLFQAARSRRAAIAESQRLEDATRAADRGRARNGGVSGAAVLVRVISPGDAGKPGDAVAQRIVATPAPWALAVGERIRIAVQPGSFRFLFVFSIDEKGVVSPLFPDSGESLALPGHAVGGAPNAMQLLPETLELTGKGAAAERLVILLTDQPLSPGVVQRAAVAAFQSAGRDLERFPRLALPGEQFHRLFIKPST